MQLSFHPAADPCYDYKNLSEANRKISYSTPVGSELCDYQLPEGWYRFVGAAGTKMPTTRVPAFRCGTNWSGWLISAHPTVEDGEVQRTVCFSDRSSGCKYSNDIIVKNCGSCFIYKLFHPPGCESRYCGTDWIWSKYTSSTLLWNSLTDIVHHSLLICYDITRNDIIWFTFITSTSFKKMESYVASLIISVWNKQSKGRGEERGLGAIHNLKTKPLLS